MGLIVWFTGLSSAGKSTLARRVGAELEREHHKVEILDGEMLRHTLFPELGFSREDRNMNVRRLAFLAELLSRHGVIVLVAAISPYREIRREIRSHAVDFIEVYVNAPLDVCEQRDVKGLYKKARSGEIQGFTGIDDPYESPLHPDLECRTDVETVEECAGKVLDRIRMLI